MKKTYQQPRVSVQAIAIQPLMGVSQIDGTTNSKNDLLSRDHDSLWDDEEE